MRAARIAAIVNGVLEARSLGESLYVSDRAKKDPVYVSWAALPPATPSDGEACDPMVAHIEQDLKMGWRLEPLPHDRTGGDDNAIYVKVDGAHALRFTVNSLHGFGDLMLTQTLITFAVIILIILFVSAYAVRSITAPLTSIASAARAFGRPGGEAANSTSTGRLRSRRLRGRSTTCATSSTSARECWWPPATTCARR